MAKIGFIYFMRSGDAVKIGWSKNPFVRMRELLTGNPLGFTSIIAIRAWPDDERKLHRQWSAYRIHGEWFRAAPPVLAMMERFGQRAAAADQKHTGQTG